MKLWTIEKLSVADIEVTHYQAKVFYAEKRDSSFHGVKILGCNNLPVCSTSETVRDTSETERAAHFGGEFLTLQGFLIDLYPLLGSDLSGELAHEIQRNVFELGKPDTRLTHVELFL